MLSEIASKTKDFLNLQKLEFWVYRTTVNHIADTYNTSEQDYLTYVFWRG